jgi:CDP-diacylglycerol--glycerol-3-phosphate 3-phosphatidyltransferase
MTTSTNETSEMKETKGALADGLTLVRLLLTPLIMFVIYLAWSGKPADPQGFVSLNLSMVLLASVLFAIAAVTDVLDDFVGGSAVSVHRKFGWFDDIADSVLIAGTLVALMYVTDKAGLLHWSFMVPAVVLIARDLIIALTKGYELSKFGFLETRLGDLKSVIAMLATCLLVAAPWLSNVVDNFRSDQNTDNIMQVYNNSSTWIWNTGLAALWIAAILSVITGLQFFTKSPDNEK